MVKDQIGASIIHDDGSKMTYDILGVGFLGKEVPIVLIGGMTSLRGDWERLAYALAENRPVLLLDHRGMGESTYTKEGDEEITIELYARDILDLLIFLQWKQIILCGFSMGGTLQVFTKFLFSTFNVQRFNPRRLGAIAQQILLLPFHQTQPTPIPFQITHTFLTGTLAKPLRDKGYGLKITTPPPPALKGHRSAEEKKAIAKPILESTFDKKWMEENKERFEVLLDRMIYGRPTKTIIQQALTLNTLHFNASHSKIPSTIPILLIHGKSDKVVPYYCSEHIQSLIPHSTFVEIGSSRGQVPNLNFGHQWFEYFEIDVWVGVIEEFVKRGDGTNEKAKL